MSRARHGRAIAAASTGVALTVAPILMGSPTGPAVALAASGCAPTAKTVVAGVPWAQQALAPQRAWVLTRGARVIVGVVDTGVSAASPALSGAVLPGRDVVAKGRGDTDCRGHGTFIAGLLAARPSSGSGLVGVAPAARVLPVRVTLDEKQVDPARVATGIRAAVDGGATVVAVGVGTDAAPAALRAAVRYAASHDVLVVATTEAGGSMTGGAVYPAALPGVVAVASIDSSGQSGASFGGTTVPALAAPGADIVSVAPHGNGNVKASRSGIAVGFVAGAAALVRDYRPRLTAAQVRHRLEATADHPTGRLPDRSLGYGIVDPVSAVATALPEESGEPTPTPAPRPLRVELPAPPDRRTADTALAASVIVAGGAGLGGITIAMVRRGRRRGWRPGGTD